MNTYKVKVDPNYPYFGIIGEPFDRKQHQNQQCGIDVYVNCVNFNTGERCLKKLYKNNIGLYFKHTGYSNMYIDSFTSTYTVVPFQVITDGPQ